MVRGRKIMSVLGIIGIVFGVAYFLVAGYLVASVFSAQDAMWWQTALGFLFGWLILPVYGIMSLFG